MRGDTKFKVSEIKFPYKQVCAIFEIEQTM